jgi:hypothetical protein
VSDSSNSGNQADPIGVNTLNIFGVASIQSFIGIIDIEQGSEKYLLYNNELKNWGLNTPSGIQSDDEFNLTAPYLFGHETS